MPGGQDFLAISPVHLGQILAAQILVQIQKVHGNGPDPQIAHLVGYAQVQPGVAAVVGPAYNDHAQLVRAHGGQHLLPPLFYARVEIRLGHETGRDGPVHVPERPPSSLASFFRSLRMILPPKPKWTGELRSSTPWPAKSKAAGEV